jgi:hypothetical protein
MYWGEAESRWDPSRYLAESFPEVRVEYACLPGRLQGCLERERGIIWLSIGLSPVEARTVLAYECGLLQQGPTPSDPCMAAAHERAAVDWAARMLIPSEMFVAAWAKCADLPAMAAFCDVDLAMFRARIRSASDAEQDEAVEAIAANRLSA